MNLSTPIFDAVGRCCWNTCPSWTDSLILPAFHVSRHHFRQWMWSFAFEPQWCFCSSRAGMVIIVCIAIGSREDFCTKAITSFVIFRTNSLPEGLRCPMVTRCSPCKLMWLQGWSILLCAWFIPNRFVARAVRLRSLHYSLSGVGMVMFSHLAESHLEGLASVHLLPALMQAHLTHLPLLIHRRQDLGIVSCSVFAWQKWALPWN